MDGRSEFFVFMGAAIGTTIALFLVQQVYASYIDVSVVHAVMQDAPRDAKIVAKRAAEKQRLASSKVTIDQAMEALAQRGEQSHRAGPVRRHLGDVRLGVPPQLRSVHAAPRGTGSGSRSG
jgi:uncharacterized protein with PIN domain